MKNFESIENYLSGDLNEQEIASFESRVQSDPVLNRELHTMREIDAALSDNEMLDLRRALATMMDTERSERNERRTIRQYLPRIVATAATVALLIGVALFMSTSKPSSQDLFDQNFETYPSLYNTRSVQISKDEVVMAMQPYDLGDFAAAKANLAALLERDPSRTDLVFYSGMCELELGNYQAAIGRLGEVRQSDFEILHEQSDWYTALAYLALSDEESAIPYFEELINSGSSFSDRAAGILEELQ